jgi:hypothetical protein
MSFVINPHLILVNSFCRFDETVECYKMSFVINPHLILVNSFCRFDETVE